ncbi:MAG: glycosyltransferase family 2 protein [Bacteroidia bacterium]
MEFYPKISIITPSYNQGTFLEKTILSVINQQYPNVEYIIIDGNSSDNSVEIVKKYQTHLTYWISEPDNGQSEAINKGLKIASGEIINWLNSDDYLEPGALFKIAAEFTHSSVQVLCAYANLYTPSHNVKKRTSALGLNYAQFIAQGHIMQPATFFLKKILDEFVPLETSLHYMMDHYLWLQYLCKNGTTHIQYVDYAVVNVLVHEDAKSYKNIHLFIKDRSLIYTSLFSAHQLPFRFPKTDLEGLKQLPFNYLSDSIQKNGKKINFYLLIQSLFKRDPHGLKKVLNMKCLLYLLFFFPKYTLLHYVINRPIT